MGAGLYLHNIFHGKDYAQSSATLPLNPSVKFACNCIDDFTMPFTEADVITLPAIITAFDEHTSFYKVSVSSTIHFFNSLRAPPAGIA
jgi:hypothetical protein